jgi:predicted CoA-binding protein
MTLTTLEAKVGDFLAQKRIAIAGVSRDNSRHPVGNQIYHRLKNSGRDVFPLNPHMQTFQGDRCYPDLRSIPGGVDGVVIITRPETTERIVRECSDAGVRRVWMRYSNGSWSELISASPLVAGYMLVLYRMYGIYCVLFGLMASAIAVTAFRRGEVWAWWVLLVGNTIALVSAMRYDWIVNAIGPFELSEYLGLALVWGALAVTAPFRVAAARSVRWTS